MIVKTYKFFNHATQLALMDNVDGYVDKQVSYRTEAEHIKKEFGLSQLLRFDLGENCDGYSPDVNHKLALHSLIGNLHEYPELTHDKLREQLAALYRVNKNEIILSAGLDSILDLITRVFFEHNDIYMMAAPDFFLFESYSERMGAIPAFIQLEEESNFRWTDTTLAMFDQNMLRLKPKLIWISNPGNPTGQSIEEDKLLKLIELASRSNTFVVVDEAYGEYIGGPELSFSRYISKYKNLLVLRTFSKAYGLAGLRLGFLMTSSASINRAMLLHRNFFPVTHFALSAAKIALNDQEHIRRSVMNNKIRKKVLFNELQKFNNLKFIPGDSTIFMMKHKTLTAERFDFELKRRGIVAGKLDQPGIRDLHYLRFTVRTNAENSSLIKACIQINNLGA